MKNKKESRKTKEETFDELEEISEDEADPDFEGVSDIERAPGPNQEEEQNTKYLRLMADFQNYKRRIEKEKADIYAFANEKLLGELVSIVDDFERALSHEADASGSFAEGMYMIFKNFKGILEKAGLEEIEALGEDFDPNVHNAVMTSPDSGYESGKVCGIIQKGYKLKNRVIRPSMVKVAE